MSHSAKFVTGDKVIKIANQDKVKEHVGHKVTVSGKLDGDTLTVLFTAETRGNLLPCSCPSNPLGGLARRASP